MSKFPIVKDGFPYIAVMFILTAIVFYISKTFAVLPLLLLIFVTYFFRNPNRKIEKDVKKFLSPADGVVMEVRELEEDQYIKGKATKVTIFLSVFNVHVNKSPIDGVVEYTHYRPGKYLPAFKSHASELNEKNTIGIKGENNIKILVSQITGLIARRIVCWVKEGDRVNQGENFGLIKFGSCTEITVPENVKVLVKPGQKIKGGITIIGVIDSEN